MATSRSASGCHASRLGTVCSAMPSVRAKGAKWVVRSGSSKATAPGMWTAPADSGWPSANAMKPSVSASVGSSSGLGSGPGAPASLASGSAQSTKAGLSVTPGKLTEKRRMPACHTAAGLRGRALSRSCVRLMGCMAPQISLGRVVMGSGGPGITFVRSVLVSYRPWFDALDLLSDTHSIYFWRGENRANGLLEGRISAAESVKMKAFSYEPVHDRVGQ